MKSLFPVVVLLISLAYVVSQVNGDDGDSYSCYQYNCPCFLKKIKCPKQCPSMNPKNHKDKICSVDCFSPKCQAVCRKRKPNCEGPGSACLDPRFIGGDGIVFYFHGKKNENFALVSDKNLQINGHFIGLRPEGRTRDFTWIQALGILLNKHTALSVEATRAAQWDQQVDHLRLSYNGQELSLPAQYPSVWEENPNGVKIERTSEKNSVLITLPEVAEITINVVPITKEDDRIHNYRIPSDDCFAHLEVQFRFYGLSDKVEGVLGRTYQPEFVNPAKPGVAMPVVGGEDKYKTSSLLDSDCKKCVFKPVEEEEESEITDDGNVLAESVQSSIDCSLKWNNGNNGLVCRK